SKMEQIVLLGDSNLLKRWSGRRDSNPRRPAWEHVTSLCLQHLRVSDALFRLRQVSPYQSFPGLTPLIEVGSRYIVFPLIPCLMLHPMAINNNGPRWNASHQPIGVKSEFPQRQYTPPRAANKRRKCNLRSPIGGPEHVGSTLIGSDLTPSDHSNLDARWIDRGLASRAPLAGQILLPEATWSAERSVITPASLSLISTLAPTKFASTVGAATIRISNTTPPAT